MLNRIYSVVTLASAAVAIILSSPLTASGYVDDEDVMGYEAILNELSRESNRPVLRATSKANRSSDPLDSVLFHGGIGLASLMQMVTFEDGSTHYLGQKGIQASFGIDLFSPYWIAEGTARTFAPTEGSRDRVSLQEFELKVFHKDRVSNQIGYRVGAGLSARYMNLHRSQDVVTYTTPSGVVTFGLDLYANEMMSLGADINGRAAMIAETPDQRSVDATLRLDFHL